jgi:hypothetical protein
MMDKGRWAVVKRETDPPGSLVRREERMRKGAKL